MFDRKELKEQAIHILKKNYLKMFVATFILIISGGVTLQGTYNFGPRSDQSLIERVFPDPKMYEMVGDFIIDFVPVFLIFGLIFTLLRIFIGYSLEVGGKRVFLDASKTEIVNLNTFYFGFHHSYLKTVKTLFVRDIKIILWTLLFIFPGIIKWYSYRFVPYILSDNPSLSTQKALEYSLRLTRKNKLKMLLLDLSFLPWILLGNFLWGIGMIFVIPYIEATMAELYLSVRDYSFEEGILEPSDLNVEIRQVVITSY